MSSPYQDETYAGTYAQNAEAEASALAGEMLGSPENMAGYTYEIAQVNGGSDAYVAAQETRARADHLGTLAGPSSAGTIYASIPHEELYRATHTDIDPSGIFENGRSWNTIGNEYADNANALLKMVSDSKAGWTGGAADDFHASMTTLAQHIGQVGEGAQSISAQLYVQSEAADTVRNKVPPPTGFNKNSALTNLFSAGPRVFETQIAQQAQAADALHAQAADATQTYEQSVTQSVATSPKFAPPPQNTGAAAKGGRPTTSPSTAGRGQLSSGTAGRPAGGSATDAATGGTGGYPSQPGGTSGAAGTPSPTGATTTSDYTGAAPTPDPTGTGLPDGSSANPNGMPTVDITPMPTGGNLGGLGGEQVRGGGFGTGPEGGSSGNVRNVLGGGGSGARSGIGAQAAEEAAMRTGAATEAAEGRAGVTGMPGGAGRKKDEDKEHETPSYLENNDLNELITGDLGETIRPVLGGEK